MVWNKSRRHEPLPPGWYKTRLRILKRDGYRCTWIRQDSTGGRCPEKANQVDHIDPLGGEGDDNLRSLCAYHHKIKSSSEGGRAVHKSQGKQMRKHPGMYRVIYAFTHMLNVVQGRVVCVCKRPVYMCRYVVRKRIPLRRQTCFCTF